MTNNANNCKAYRERKAKKNAALGVVDKTLPVPKGIWSMLVDLCTWHKFEDWKELLFTMVRVAHSKGPEWSELTTIPKCGFVPTRAQLRLVSLACNKCGGSGENDGIECKGCNDEN